MQKKSLCADDLLREKIEQYSPMVYRLAFSMVKSKSDADDIHQEVFIRYIISSPTFASENHERAWLIRVTTNLSKNWWKTAWKRKVISLSEYKEQAQESSIEEGITLIEMVKTLPQKYRVVIHLFYYEEMSITEIAKVLDMKEATVRTQLTRARKRLGELLKEDI